MRSEWQIAFFVTLLTFLAGLSLGLELKSDPLNALICETDRDKAISELAKDVGVLMLEIERNRGQ